MKPSTSKYIAFESVSIPDLFKLAPGAFGLYLPARDENGKVQKSMAKIAAGAKSAAVHAKKRCVVQTLVILEQSVEGEIPAPQRMLKVTVTPIDQISERGQRYKDAQKPGAREKALQAKVKVFAVNLDGVHNVMVAAPSLKAAADLIGTTVYLMRTYDAGVNDEDKAVALATVGQVFRQEGINGAWEPWTPDAKR